MHMILGKAIADVDEACFEKIGYMAPEVVAVPVVDQMLAIKGSASCTLDDETECQNTLFLTYDAGAGAVTDFKDAMEPGVLYRYSGDLSQYQNIDFVELKSEQAIGQLKLVAYFLVPTTDCEFAVKGCSDDDEFETYTLTELWQNGLIRRLNNG